MKKLVTFYVPVINWPRDYQGRIYKNADHIKWQGNVHERVFGFEMFAALPPEEFYAIRHHKTINKQEQQNEYYDTIV